MGHNRTFKTVHDATRYNADIVIACPACNHTLVVDRETLEAILRERHKNRALYYGMLHYMRCHRCGKRGAIIEITMKGDKRTITLRDGDPLPPPGVPIGVWIKALGSERPRLRRRVPK